MRRNRKRRLIKRNLISLFLIVAIMSGLALSIYYSKTSQTMIAHSIMKMNALLPLLSH